MKKDMIWEEKEREGELKGYGKRREGVLKGYGWMAFLMVTFMSVTTIRYHSRLMHVAYQRHDYSDCRHV